MIYQILLILILEILQGWCQKVEVTQRLRLLIVRDGQPVNMSCHQNNKDNYVAVWYQQKRGRALQTMAYSPDPGIIDMEAGYGGWRLQRPSNLQSSLSKAAAEAQDAAEYFCASSRTVNAQKLEFGTGTVLFVLGAKEEIKPPKVSIYLPSKQEVEDHNFISLVCVASDFFPEHVNITWFVDGVERVNLYKPVPQKKTDASGGSSYSTSKRLTLTRSEYFNPDSTFQCQAAFLDGSNMTSAEVKGETDCSISKETYTIHINQGKISYIMILCKSGLYALVVLALLWRKKVIFNSY